MSVFDALVDNVLTAAASNPDAWAVGEIIEVTPAGGWDGFDLVTVRWRGADHVAPHFASYTPVVGHQVLMARFGPQLVVLDRIVGTPPRA